MFDNMLSLNEAMITSYAAAGQIGERGILKNVFPRGAFKTKKGFSRVLLTHYEPTWNLLQ